MRPFGFLGGALVLSALGAAACNGDDSSYVPPGSDTGNDSAPPGDDASLGSDSAAPPGEDATLPTDAGVDASVPADAGIDAHVPAESGADGSLTADGGLDASPVDAGGDSASVEAAAEGGPIDGGDAGGPSYALFVGTDFVNAELAVVALHPDTVAGRLPVADQDSVAAASGGSGFVIEHTIGKVVVLDHAQPWMAQTTIDTNDVPDAATAYGSNPHAIVVTTGTKAYVARYSSNVVKIVDIASGAITGNLDLSAYLAPDDTDGLVDVQDAAYDAATGRAYFLLQRTNQFDFGPAPDFVGACLASHAEIVGVDVTNDSIVDLNGAAAGTAIDLLGDDPPSLTPDFAGGRIIVPETGCYQRPDAGDAAAAARLGRGVESVSLSTGTPTWLYQSSAVDRLQGIVWADATHAFVNQGSDWFAWNPTQTTLGSAIANFPQAPLYDGAGRVVGLSFGTPDAGADAAAAWSVVAMGVETSQLSTIAGNPFQSVVPASGYGVTSAFLR